MLQTAQKSGFFQDVPSGKLEVWFIIQRKSRKGSMGYSSTYTVVFFS